MREERGHCLIGKREADNPCWLSLVGRLPKVENIGSDKIWARGP